MSNTVLRTSLLTIDATGLYPFFRRGRRGSGQGEARAGSEGPSATGEKAGEGKLEGAPALSCEQVLSQSCGRAAQDAPVATLTQSRRQATTAAPRTGPSRSQPPMATGKSPQDATPRGARERGQVGVPRPPRAPRSERARFSDPAPRTPKTHRLTATPEELERNAPASTPHPKSRWPGRQSRSVREENAPTPSTADPLGRPPPLASSEAHAPPGLDRPTLGN